ncbi:DUF3369 domain-containing protein [Hwanghaeella sp.]|uniref:DUF3369 domain-containing protein n=1 Tax=Hwanghaeella sp. TaxID=2605943 RepID=UPI003CCBFB12
MSDTLIFASPLMRRAPEEPEATPWKILVVDDEPDIHAITKIALSDFRLDNRGILQLHAYSAKEARSILEENPDIAMLLLDVVMESDGAGLDLVRYIRTVLGNTAMRIVLRTGNPGHAPERRVIAEYDINDYREKSELTTQKLNTVMYTALRSYRDILTTEEDKRRLERLVDASVELFTHRSLEDLKSRTIEQICTLLHPATEDKEQTERDALLAHVSDDGVVDIMGVSGAYLTLESAVSLTDLPSDLSDDIRKALNHDGVYQAGDRLIAHETGPDNGHYIAFVAGKADSRDIDKRLLEILLGNIALAIQTLENANKAPSAEIVRIH